MDNKRILTNKHALVLQGLNKKYGTVHGIRAKQLRSKKRKKTNWKDAVKEGYELTSHRLEKRKTEDESLKNAGNRKKNAKEALKNQEFKTVRMKEEEEVRFHNRPNLPVSATTGPPLGS